MKKTAKHSDKVEVIIKGMVDKDGLNFVLSILASVCREKAAHLYPLDKEASRIWSVNGQLIDDLVDKL